MLTPEIVTTIIAALAAACMFFAAVELAWTIRADRQQRRTME